MADMYGYTGKILMVDLSTGEISTLKTADYAEWYGGRGIGAKIHWDMVGPDVKAFDPENVITLLAGPGTGIIDSRLVVQSLTPLGYPVESYYRSTMGSHFGAEMRFAGWDGIVIKGKAENLSYLLIEDGDVSIRDGRELRQLDTYATQQHLWSRHTPDHKICLIGPAGENLVRDAHLQCGDHNACGLGGFGSVFGSKNLKAIACRGTQGSPAIADPETLLAVRFEESQILSPNPGVGAAAGSELELAGNTGEARVGMAGCFGCQMPCGYSVKYKDGSTVAMGSVKCGEFLSCSAELEQTGEYVGKNQWKRITQQGLLGLTGQPSYRMIYNDDVNEYYDEPITLLHNKIITEADMGIDHPYGTPEFTDAFNRGIAYREPGMLGEGFAEGQAKLCYEYLGTQEAIDDYNMNNMRAGMHGFCPGFYHHLYRTPGLVMRMTTTINAGDTRSMYYYLLPMYYPFQANAEELGASFASWEWTHAAEAAKFMQDFKTMMDTALRCFYPVGADAMSVNGRFNQRMHAAITGTPFDEAYEKEICEKIWLLERSIQARQGHKREDDQLCDVIYENYGQFGVTPEAANEALDQYYDMRGIDHETGLPKRSEYERLGLGWVADSLEKDYGIAIPA